MPTRSAPSLKDFLFVIARGKEAATLALHRFGFGPAGFPFAAYSITTLAADPRGALLAELERTKPAAAFANLPSSAQAARDISDFRAEEQAKKKLAQRALKGSDGKEASAGTADAASMRLAAVPMSGKPDSKEPPLPQRVFQDEAAARLDAAVSANIGFVERLVWFWSNHFCVSADKDSAMVGAYEREAIRAHVLGRFGDMLAAVESHPAMLLYLDNVQSMGANSIAGINRDKGLNENLAREILELHTLGVRSGYTQTDVTAFANVLTGWTWIDPAEPEHGGEFLFNKRLHEPGAWRERVCRHRAPPSMCGQAAGNGSASAASSISRPCSGNPCGGRRRRTATPTPKRRGSTACRGGSTSPMNSPGNCAAKLIRSNSSSSASAR
jgi:uncharacterized protein (DUF1800 family)